MARPQTGSKKQEIIAAAIALFLERGIRGTTIQDIASRAGVAVGTVYLYCKDKKEIVREVAYAFAKQHKAFASETLQSRKNPLAKLNAYLLGLYDMWQPFGANETGPIELAAVVLSYAPETLKIAETELQQTLSSILEEAKDQGLNVKHPQREARWIAISTAVFFPLAGTPNERPLNQKLGREELKGLLSWIGSKLKR